jgi:hypothetical protein
MDINQCALERSIKKSRELSGIYSFQSHHSYGTGQPSSISKVIAHHQDAGMKYNVTAITQVRITIAIIRMINQVGIPDFSPFTGRRGSSGEPASSYISGSDTACDWGCLTSWYCGGGAPGIISSS